MNSVETAMNAHDLTALQAVLEVSATAVLDAALQISRDAKASLSEVLITPDGLTGRAADVLATLLHEAAHSVAWRRGMKDTSRQGRYHNRRFQTVAQELGLQVERESAFGWTQTDLRASTAAAYSVVLGELEHHVPRAGAAANGSQRRHDGITTLACHCGHRLVRDGRSGFLAEASTCSGCLTDPD
jgi:hypothetical protein